MFLDHIHGLDKGDLKSGGNLGEAPSYLGFHGKDLKDKVQNTPTLLSPTQHHLRIWVSMSESHSPGHVVSKLAS